MSSYTRSTEVNLAQHPIKSS